MLLNKTNQPGQNRLESAWRIVSAVAAVAFVCTAFAAPRAWADDPNATVATVGAHKITEKDLDAKVKPQLDQMHAMLEKRVDQLIADKTFDLRRETLESMTDDYLIQQAAEHDKLSVDDYLKKEYSGKSAVTDAEAKAFYDKNKGQGAAPYDKIKPQLMQMMNRQALLERLRKDEPVKILLEPKRIAVDSSGHPTLGAKDAPVTIVEFADFQCPFCKATEATLKDLRGQYGDKIRLVHMDFPLPFHAHAMDAANAARCANEQGKFWQYREALFSNQSKLTPADLKTTARTLGLNTTKFDSCFDKSKYDALVKADQAAGEKAGVDGTPAFFIDGRPLTGAQPAPKFQDLINDELATGGNTKQASAQ
ncbi:MAG: thioredoxin domain-containing protein [Candidatus Binatus sp.]|jgi:protein-disulfide isomerase|uniref:thioredoxin domain-containing protein n=1 Tax=Candidatus Binatus sp. TaxID=2811406 RepID=UPI003C706F05